MNRAADEVKESCYLDSDNGNQVAETQVSFKTKEDRPQR